MYNNGTVTVSLGEYESNVKRIKSMKEKIKFLESEDHGLVMVKVDANEYYFKKSDEEVKEINSKSIELVEKLTDQIEKKDLRYRDEIELKNREIFSLKKEKELLKQQEFESKLLFSQFEAKLKKKKYELILVASILTLALGLAIAL